MLNVLPPTGAVCDFRLGYGRSLSRKSKIIAVNRNKEQLNKVTDVATQACIMNLVHLLLLNMCSMCPSMCF